MADEDCPGVCDLHACAPFGSTHGPSGAVLPGRDSMSREAWVAWGITTLLTLIFGFIAIAAWRRPKSPPSPRRQPPDLRLERVGGIGSGTGAPREHVKAKLRLVNDGTGEATGWQVVIVNEQGC